MAAVGVLIAALNATNVPLGFLSPYVGPNGLDLLHYNQSQLVNVTWTTPFNRTTLEVWQGPDEDGFWQADVIAANWTRQMNMLLWRAAPVMGTNLSYGFHFRLQKGDEPNDCNACMADSASFRVLNTSTTQTTSSTSSATSTPLQTAAVTTSTATSSQTVTSDSNSDSSESRDLAIGLGVGLGVGFPLLVLGLVFLALRRRRKQRERASAADRRIRQLEKDDLYSSGPASRMSRMTHSRFEFETPEGTIIEGWESLFGSVERLRMFLNRKPSQFGRQSFLRQFSVRSNRGS